MQIESHGFELEGFEGDGLRILGVNGIRTSLSQAVLHARYLQQLAQGHAIGWIYNRSRGWLDVLEVAFCNYLGCSLRVQRILADAWRRFHAQESLRPEAKLLQVCHSQGALAVRNALAQVEREVAERVIVVAIAPAADIAPGSCFRAVHYVSQSDFLHLGELAFAGALGSDREVERAFMRRRSWIRLAPEQGGIDHDFQSPTFRRVLASCIQQYLQGKIDKEG